MAKLPPNLSIVVSDIHPTMLKVARRLQAEAAQGSPDGLAIIKATIVVRGLEPVFWIVPDLVRLEPIKQADKAQEVLFRLFGEQAETDMWGDDDGN